MSEISAIASEPSVTPAPGQSPGAPIEDDLIQLRAVFGQDEANHGTMRYLVGPDGLVQVPRHAVGPLVTLGGFVLATIGNDTISSGLVNLHHDSAAGCSYAGRQYLGEANGNVIVPAEAASQLLAHGFVAVSDQETTARSRANSPPRSRFKRKG